MPQRVKTCSVFDSRSMTIDYYSLFTHIVYKSGPEGADRSDGNPWGSGSACLAVDAKIL